MPLPCLEHLWLGHPYWGLLSLPLTSLGHLYFHFSLSVAMGHFDDLAPLVLDVRGRCPGELPSVLSRDGQILCPPLQYKSQLCMCLMVG